MSNIVEQILKSHNYIILLSGLDKSPINTIANELAKDLKEYEISLDFMHLDINDNSDVISNRLSEIVNNDKNHILIVKSKIFKKDIKIPNNCYVIHIHISISDKMIDDVKLANEYNEALKNSSINKYFNYKDKDLNTFIDDIFFYIMKDIEKKLYGKNYKKIIENVDVKDNFVVDDLDDEVIDDFIDSSSSSFVFN